MRYHRLDNAKAALIFLVVLGHFLELVDGWQDSLLRIPLTFIYMFHMPAFVFLAGMTAKQDNLGKRIANLLVLLLMFQAAYTLPSFLLKGTYPVGPLQPYWMLWFLLSMVWWLIALPILKETKAPLTISVLVALGIGMIPGVGYPLSACRTLVFLPFFVAGSLYGQRILALLPSSLSARLLASVLLCALTTTLYTFGIDHPWLNAYANYETLGIDAVSGLAIRIGVMACSAFASISFLMLVPSNYGWLSRIGAASMTVFLLHGFFVKASRQGMEALMAQHGAIYTFVAAVTLALVVTAVLARPWLEKLIRNVAAAVVSRLHSLGALVRG